MSGVDHGMLRKANDLVGKFGGLTPAPNVFRFGEANGTNASFPVQLGSTDPEDRKYKLRQKLVGADGNPGVVDKVGVAVADDKFFEYAKRKEEQAILYDFYNFMFAQADLSKPESANWWFSKFPWMRDMRLKEIDKQADLQKTLARLQVTGPESEDDFMLMFLIRNGTIIPPTTPLYDMGRDQNLGAKSYQEGFFSKLVSGRIWSNPTAEGGVFAQPPGVVGGYGAKGMKVIYNNPIPQYAQQDGIGWRPVMGQPGAAAPIGFGGPTPAAYGMGQPTMDQMLGR